MNQAALDRLPDELLHDITARLSTTRDVGKLAALSRGTHAFTERGGWETFVKTSFSSIKVPCSPLLPWDKAARRLTYLDRCWDTRAFDVYSYGEYPLPPRMGRRGGPRGQSVSYHPSLSAALLPDSLDEIVAVGAGEDLVVRYTNMVDSSKSKWMKLKGNTIGYRPGTGDITTVSILDREAYPEIVAGRANGDLSIFAIQEDAFLSEPVQLLARGESYYARPMQIANSYIKSLAYDAITSTAWESSTKMLATCQGTRLQLYNLSESPWSTKTVLNPQTICDVSTPGVDESALLVRNVAFLSSDTIACGLGGAEHALRWGHIRPTGVELRAAAENNSIDDILSIRTEGLATGRTTVRAIELVSGYRGRNMMLSAWDDGTIRLADLRTPSAHDAVYRDRFQPYQASSSLLVYGTEHFIAGSNHGPEVRFFDFRNPTKTYHHTDTLPCSSELPSQPPAFGHVGPDVGAKPSDESKCSVKDGKQCTFHRESKRSTWRPDAMLHLGNVMYDRVSALAKTSDLASSFYCGVRGSVMEMRLVQSGHEESISQEQTVVSERWVEGRPRAVSSLIETGVGHTGSLEWLHEESGVPVPLYLKRGSDASGSDESREGTRLDACWNSGPPVGRRTSRFRWQ